MSGSRVIMRWAISPQGSPSGAPRRIRRTLYCVAERLSVLSTWAGRRDKMSVVRSRSRNAASSGPAARRRLFCDWLVSFITLYCSLQRLMSRRLSRRAVRRAWVLIARGSRPYVSEAAQRLWGYPAITLAVVPHAELTTVLAEPARRNLIRPIITQGHLGDALPEFVSVTA